MTTENDVLGGLDGEFDPPVYDQLEGESALHFSWFHAFLMLGPGRSLRSAYAVFHQKASKSPKKPELSSCWKEAARRWRWLERAQAWDAKQREARELEVDAAMRATYDQLLERGRRLLKISDAMGNFPLVETESTTIDSKGHKTIILKPTRWSMDTSARMATVAAAMFKAAFDLEESRVRSEVDNESTEDAIEGAIETLKSLGYIVVAPGEAMPEGEDEDD